MMRSLSIWLALTVALVSPALAHTGVGQTNSFSAGMAHPLDGADHILAMVAVGLWGMLAGGHAIWAWPAGFVAMMLAGFAAATFGLKMPFVDPVIWSSVVILALLAALAVKVPVSLGVAITGFFALFHGYAHGGEVAAASFIPYAAGFGLATVGLHATGIGLGLFAKTAIGKIGLEDASQTESQRCSR